MTVIVAKIKDRIVQVIQITDTVAFSKEKGWICICMDWEQAERKKSQFKWVPVASTRFEWVRKFTF